MVVSNKLNAEEANVRVMWVDGPTHDQVRIVLREHERDDIEIHLGRRFSSRLS